MRADRDQIKVVIIAEHYKLIGNIHIVPGGRITDFLASRVSGNFIPVTDAKVYTDKEEKLILETKFLTVNASYIVMLYPLVEPKGVQ